MSMIKNIFLVALVAFIFISCANNKSGVINVNKVDYPDGINVIIHNKDLRSDLEIISSRLVNSKYKKQVQMVINNTSSDTYNLVVGHEWTDSRGTIINNHMLKSRVTLRAESSQRIVLNAPSFKAKDVLINISCANKCVEE